MPQRVGQGATFQGTINIGNYEFRMWTYNGKYKDPATGNIVPYVTAGKVIMLSEGGRLDATFGNIPRLRSPEQQAIPYLPERMSNSDARVDLITNAWFTDDGENLMVGCAARPLLIPTAIDTYGCLTT